MEPSSHSFPANVRVGLADPVLQRALGLARTGFPLRRQQAIERLPEFEALREEPPSHIIAPAIHLMKEQVADAFRAAHKELDPGRNIEEPRALCEEARTILRPQFLAADVGITGANFLIAETGSSIIVTNEGNGDLTQTLPRIHIVVTSLEKIVPTLEDATTLLRLLARSATGQEFSSYTTMSTGPRRAGDLDGPAQS